MFDPTIHKPPRIDGFGYNKETHKGRELLNRNTKNILDQPNNQIPLWWTSKNIRDPNFGSTLVSPRDECAGVNKYHARVESMPVPASKSVNHAKKRSIDLHLPEKKTRTKLIESRKKEILPDISYDLDGDGFVGGRDYVVARRFDEGFKNALTKEEREKAIEAVKNVSKLKITQFFNRDMKTSLSGTLRLQEHSANSEFSLSVD